MATARPSSSSLVLRLLLLLCSSILGYAATLRERALEKPPSEFENGWIYQGCYIDVGRTINRANQNDALMTNQLCVEFCFEKGHPYAGTEFNTECYCGDKLATGGVKAPDADCNTPCGGAAAEPCGGPNRLTLYKTSGIEEPADPEVNPGVDGWTSLGCYTEGVTGRTLTYAMNTVPANQMTVAKCTAGCKAARFTLSGLEFGGECCK
jgi:hypothetical protein